MLILALGMRAVCGPKYSGVPADTKRSFYYWALKSFSDISYTKKENPFRNVIT